LLSDATCAATTRDLLEGASLAGVAAEATYLSCYPDFRDDSRRNVSLQCDKETTAPWSGSAPDAHLNVAAVGTSLTPRGGRLELLRYVDHAGCHQLNRVWTHNNNVSGKWYPTLLAGLQPGVHRGGHRREDARGPQGCGARVRRRRGCQRGVRGGARAQVPQGRAASLPPGGCQISYMDHTGCHQLNVVWQGFLSILGSSGGNWGGAFVDIRQVC
jgi:hypothetical protein